MNGARNVLSRVTTGLLPVREIMSVRVATIKPGEAASEAWNRMRRRRIRHLVVLEGPRVVGVLSERDLGGRAGADMRKARSVRDLMTPHVVTANPDTTVREAADVMRKRLIGCLPIVKGNRLVGIVTATDVFDAVGSAASRTLSRAERQLLRAPSSSKRLGGQPGVSLRSRVRGKMPRDSTRAAGKQKRLPFAKHLPKALKRAAGRMEWAPVPANIRVVGVEINQDERAYIRQRLGLKLGKYASSIERVTVRLKDVNGPRGGVDQLCRIKVVLSGLPSVVFQSRAVSLDAAVNGALTGLEHAVRRTVQRRRMKSNRGRGDGATVPAG